MSSQTYELIENILIKASMERGKIHWAKIFAHCREYIGASEKHEIKKIADKWGVEIIGK
jgi:hypothetical protein